MIPDEHVPIVSIEASILIEGFDKSGCLTVVFDTAYWNISKNGLIYTDTLWLEKLKEFLQENGFSAAAVTDVDYSEQGRQGYDFVDLDIGSAFINELDPIVRFVHGKSSTLRIPTTVIYT